MGPKTPPDGIDDRQDELKSIGDLEWLEDLRLANWIDDCEDSDDEPEEDECCEDW